MYNKAILLRHHYFLCTKAEGSNVRYYPYAYVNGCSVPAGQPATKGPHLLSKGYYSCCARLVKKMQRDNVYQRQRRTPSFYIAITAAYQHLNKGSKIPCSAAVFQVVTHSLYLFLNPTHFMLSSRIQQSTPPKILLCLQHKSVEVAASSFFLLSSSPSLCSLSPSFVRLYHVAMTAVITPQQASDLHFKVCRFTSSPGSAWADNTGSASETRLLVNPSHKQQVTHTCTAAGKTCNISGTLASSYLGQSTMLLGYYL